MSQLSDHAFLSPHFEGLGWTKASILTSCDFIGGGRNAIFEFSERFADLEDLFVTTQSLHLLLLLENIVCENHSDSSLFVTIVPRRFGLCANHEAFVTKVRLYLNIPFSQLILKEKRICSNSPQLTLRHALNSPKLTTDRSSLHNACIKEPLLKETLSLNNFGSDDRGDVYCDWIDNSEAIVDFVSCNVANDTLVHRRKLNPVAALDFKAKEKHRKYDKDIEEVLSIEIHSWFLLLSHFR
ncbi:hypothetical protein P9112_003691 [Eukaryota sp. TZLM1-RC]